MKKSPKNGDSAQQAWAVVQQATSGDSPIPIDIAGRRINLVLEDKGYSSSEITTWWNTENLDLGGRTPHQVWFSEIETSAETIVRVHLAASSSVTRM